MLQDASRSSNHATYHPFLFQPRIALCNYDERTSVWRRWEMNLCISWHSHHYISACYWSFLVGICFQYVVAPIPASPHDNKCYRNFITLSNKWIISSLHPERKLRWNFPFSGLVPTATQLRSLIIIFDAGYAKCYLISYVSVIKFIRFIAMWTSSERSSAFHLLIVASSFCRPEVAHQMRQLGTCLSWQMQFQPGKSFLLKFPSK